MAKETDKPEDIDPNLPVPAASNVPVPVDDEDPWSTDAEFTPAGIGRLRLLQGLSPLVSQGAGRPGEYHMEGHEGALDTPLLVIPVMTGVFRQLWWPQDPDAVERNMICSSSGGRVGHGDPGGNCQICPYAQWSASETPGGKSKPPACTFIRSYMLYIPETGQPARWDLKSTGLRVADRIQNYATMQQGFSGKWGMLLSATESGRGTRKYQIPVVAFTDKEIPELPEWLDFSVASSPNEDAINGVDGDLPWDESGVTNDDGIKISDK